jgi:hypothetical protein
MMFMFIRSENFEKNMFQREVACYFPAIDFMWPGLWRLRVQMFRQTQWHKFTFICFTDKGDARY